MNKSPCQNCPERRVGCHNEAVCSKWGEFEKTKEKKYAESRKRSDIIGFEKRRILDLYKKVEHDKGGRRYR